MPLEIETAELLSNLCPDTQESLMFGSRDSIPRYHPSSIAFALGRVKKKNAGAVYLLRIKYAGEDCWDDLDIRLWMRIVDLSTRQNWKYPLQLKGQEFYRRMGRLAAFEHIHHHVCPTCQGRAEAMIENKIVQCGTCNGTSRKVIDDTVRANLLNVSPEFFAHPWSQRYQRIRFILNAWEQKGLNIVRNSL